MLTVQGRLDTSTGAVEGKLALRKKFFPEASRAKWFTRADLGASYDSNTDEILYGVQAKKSVDLTFDGLLTLEAKGGVQMSAARRKVPPTASFLSLPSSIMNFEHSLTH